MAAKKKRRGLSGTRAEHQAESNRTFNLAHEGFARARDLMRSSKCSDALDAVVVASQYTAMAFDNGFHARLPDTSLLQEVRDTKDAFRKACLVGGGLSGMKRRSRR